MKKARKRDRRESSVFDPTDNVHGLVAMNVARLDDLRLADQAMTGALRIAESARVAEALAHERRRVDEQMTLRAEFAAQLSLAEAKRIDAIRAVDVNAVSVANERATAQAAVLANQVSASAETLRALVAATAQTVAQQLAQLSAQLTDRLSSLEKAQYETKGKSGVSTPLIAAVATGVGGLIVFVLQQMLTRP